MARPAPDPTPLLNLAAQDSTYWPEARAAVLRNQISSCTRCLLHHAAQVSRRGRTYFNTGPVPFAGPPTASILLIGEAPGYWEDRYGAPFVGEAGQLLDEALSRAGIDPTAVAKANLVQCRPPGNRDPYAAEVAACRQWVDAITELIRPDVIVAVGRHAQRTFGVERDSWADDRAVVGMTHPAWYLWKSDELAEGKPLWGDMKDLLEGVRWMAERVGSMRADRSWGVLWPLMD